MRVEGSFLEIVVDLDMGVLEEVDVGRGEQDW